MSVAARRVTAARSPETVSLSTNIRLPSTGSVNSNSISSRQGSWSSARTTAWGTVAAIATRTATMTAIPPLPGPRRLHSGFSAMWSRRCPRSPRLRRLPNHVWGRKGIRPSRRAPPLRFFLRILRRARFDLRAIRRRGPGPDLTGCGGAGGSLRANWETGPAYRRAPSLYFSRSAATSGNRRPPIFPTTIATPTSPRRTAIAILTWDGPTGA